MLIRCNMLQFVLVSHLLLAVSGASCTKETKNATAPAMPTSISILTRSWQLHVKQDGSGDIRYGSNPDDHAAFASNTFQYKTVVQRLMDHSQSSLDRRNNWWSVVELTGPAAGARRTMYCSDREMITKLFDRSVEKCSSERMRELWKANPENAGSKD